MDYDKCGICGQELMELAFPVTYKFDKVLIERLFYICEDCAEGYKKKALDILIGSIKA